MEDSGEILMRQVALGSKKWIDTIRKTLKGHREQPESRSLQVRLGFNEVIAAVEKVRKAPWKEFCQRRGDWGRNMAWYLGWRECLLTQRQLGEASGGAEYAAVSAAIKSMERKLARDKGLQRRLAAAKRHPPI